MWLRVWLTVGTMSTLSARTSVVVRLGVAQTLAWASSYYLPAVLAPAMAADLRVSPSLVFGAFSVALVVTALCGRWAGRLIDRYGGRPVLVGTNVLFAAGLAGMALAEGPLGLGLAWVVMGLAMAGGLYEGAFSALVRLYGHEARSSITGITLIAGLASTVGWPLSAWAEQAWGWRGACLLWMGLHLLVALPLNASLPRATPHVPVPQSDGGAASGRASAALSSPWPTVLLATVFALAWFVSTAMAAHLPRLLQAHGLTLGVALGLAALVGPAQVAGRLLEFGLLRKAHPLLSAQLATLTHPVGALLFMGLGAPAAWLFTVLHGAGNGILTIAKGTLPLAIFGAQGYGARQGVLMAPARLAQALAPFLFGLVLDRFGGTVALWVSSMAGLTALCALRWLQRGLSPAAA